MRDPCEATRLTVDARWGMSLAGELPGRLASRYPTGYGYPQATSGESGTPSRDGWNALQVQRWLGHHKPSFTSTVHLLEADIPRPHFFDTLHAERAALGNVSSHLREESFDGRPLAVRENEVCTEKALVLP
jgi:hypothetical protein